MYLLGYDLGSSSVKVSLLDAQSNKLVASASAPEDEMKMGVPHPGWAEQDPDTWWHYIKEATAKLKAKTGNKMADVRAVGIAYQMHGLVLVDKDKKVLRPAIIWCDSRAVGTGSKTEAELGTEFCLEHFLNLPGNFTASKLRWVKENEPAVFAKVAHFMLPGDFVAMKLTDRIQTTSSGLSEGIFWDFPGDKLSLDMLKACGIPEEWVPEIVPVFSKQAMVTQAAASELGIPANIPVAYRAGDQPNNALSLGCLEAGDVAATAGTSGVVYAVGQSTNYDAKSRVNTFIHVNHKPHDARYGTLMCINGTGILFSWLRHNTGADMDYPKMDELSAKVSPGSDDLRIFPYGNGAERTLGNTNLGSMIENLHFNTHTQGHLFRAAQEGIVYAFNYGMEIIENMGNKLKKIKAGKANMFLSDVFREVFANVSGKTVELYDTDGSMGAARGAGIGAGIFKNNEEAFSGLTQVGVTEPKPALIESYRNHYLHWKTSLENKLNSLKK
ncbi:MAG: carbohydrate kinase [Spirochaetales bacterium]|nr:carbohydrate kinase [Spirochaetales bacterium]